MSMNRTCQPSTRRHPVENSGVVCELSQQTFAAMSRWRLPVLSWMFLLVPVLSFFDAAEGWAQPAKPGTGVDKKPAKDDLVIDPVKLPPRFQPPPAPLEIMTLDLPIATKDELDKLKKEALPKFNKIKTECDLSAQSRKVIQDFIRYKLAIMTVKDVPDRGPKEQPIPQVTQLPQLHQRFIATDIANIGNPAVRPAEKAAFVEFLNKEIVRQMPELLRNNFYVRLHAVMILGEMDYAGAYELLLHVIQAKDIHVDREAGQPEAVKIAAAMGLIRILRFANPPPLPKERNAIAHAVISELMKAETHWWFQLRLIEALRHCDIQGVDPGNNNKPFVVDALVTIIKDPNRHWYVRAKACYALGRVPLPPSIVPGDVITVVADFAWEMATEAAGKPNNPGWKGCFWDLYLAFKPNDTAKEKDLDAEKKLAGGFLARTKQAATPAYNLIVPIVSDVLHDKVPNAGSRQNLKAFVDGQRPVGGIPKVTAPPNNNGEVTPKPSQDLPQE